MSQSIPIPFGLESTDRCQLGPNIVATFGKVAYFRTWQLARVVLLTALQLTTHAAPGEDRRGFEDTLLPTAVVQQLTNHAVHS